MFNDRQGNHVSGGRLYPFNDLPAVMACMAPDGTMRSRV